MNVEPLASMRCWAITVDLGGREFEIPALPAVDWWPILASGHASGILDLLRSDTPAGDDALDTMLLSGQITSEEIGRAVEDVVTEATGRTFHAAFVLATVASASWSFVGARMALAGFRWDVQPIGAALDAIYAIVSDNLDDKKRGEFLAILDNDSISQPGRKRTPSQRVIDEFEAMAGPRPAPSPLPGKASAGPSGSRRTRTRTRPRQRLQDDRSGEPTSPP